MHSEGVRSEAPPLPAKNGQFVQQGEEGGLVVMPDQDSSSSEMYSLGDISEADERVKKFYGLIPKNGPMEIKTVRMVKRDSKERSVIFYRISNSLYSSPHILTIDRKQIFTNFSDFLAHHKFCLLLRFFKLLYYCLV